MFRESGEEAFHQLRRDADEVLRLRKRLPALLERRSVLSFGGFGDLLDQVLPQDTDAELRIARALHLSEGALSRLRASQMDPAVVSAPSLALLARAMGLDWESFATLVERDHARFVPEQELLQARRAGVVLPFLQVCQAAWERETMDDASGL
jgi:transcriptional regulator with XRE-family HTH domain